MLILLPRNKNIKAQVTIFIIIGIILVFALLIWFYVSGISSKRAKEQILTEDDLTMQSQAIKENIDSCVQSLTDKGIQTIGSQGFYLDIPGGGYRYDANSAYWLKNKVNIMPNSLTKIEDDITYYVQSNLASCVAFSKFERGGWEINGFNPVVKAKILPDNVLVEASYTVNIRRDQFEREFSNSIYTPEIKLRSMYIKSADFVNNQLLKFCFNSSKPLDGYDSGSYSIDCQQRETDVLLCSITDPQSKIIDGKPFTLRFAADLKMNHAERIYRRGSRILFSPDRNALLLFAQGSPDTISMTQYKTDSVTRTNTPIGKKNSDIIGYTDQVFITSNPIYRFYPIGLSFDTPALLTICSSGDDDVGLLHNGEDGWIPYPSTAGQGIIGTVMYGFKQ